SESVGEALQGTSVAISADGNTAIVGGNRDNNGQGAVWVYTWNGSNWIQQGNKLVGTGNVGAAFQGTFASISADGNTIIEIGNQDDNTGAAWVFTRNNGIWTQQGSKLEGTDDTGVGDLGVSQSVLMAILQ
ncbi:MAG TPA: hypothetical protein VHE59_14920, partial [Mucilaginibacter sp.]|nr:hypothetical protein [Mucilaginibacter sp.]